MKKLFAIKEASTGRVLEDKDFELKSKAKEERKRLNKRNNDGKEIFDYVITLGVDHDDYVTDEQRKEIVIKHSVKRKKIKMEETVAG